jgi:ATP adenylyltransferase
MSLDHLWAGWRRQYIERATGESQDGDACVFCRILASGEADADTHILWRGQWCLAILNAYPYTSGHLMVMPLRHVADLEDLGDEEAAELFDALRRAVVAVKSAYRPDGLNVGANLGKAGGAGIPGHLHLHVLPRWEGDTNFMTAVAGTRVLPETLDETWQKLRGGFG